MPRFPEIEVTYSSQAGMQVNTLIVGKQEADQLMELIQGMESARV